MIYVGIPVQGRAVLTPNAMWSIMFPDVIVPLAMEATLIVVAIQLYLVSMFIALTLFIKLHVF